MVSEAKAKARSISSLSPLSEMHVGRFLEVPAGKHLALRREVTVFLSQEGSSAGPAQGRDSSQSRSQPDRAGLSSDLHRNLETSVGSRPAGLLPHSLFYSVSGPPHVVLGTVALRGCGLREVPKALTWLLGFNFDDSGGSEGKLRDGGEGCGPRDGHSVISAPA